MATRQLTVDLTETEAMAGVPKKLAGMTTGCRLILAKLSKCVLLLPRETGMAMNGSQTSSCFTHRMETFGHLIKMQMAWKWWDLHVWVTMIISLRTLNSLVKPSHGILQFLSFDWFTGHGIWAHIQWTTMYGRSWRVSEKSQGAQN